MENRRLEKQIADAFQIGKRLMQVREIAAEINKTAPLGEEITEEQIMAVQRNIMRTAEMLKSPEGKYKVIGIDMFYAKDWIQGEYETAEEALRVARELTDRGKLVATDHSVAKVFYAYDPEGKYLGGDTWHGE